MSFISRKRKPKDVEEESKKLQGRFAESLTQEFEKLSLKSSKRIKGRKENSKKDLLNSRQSIELPLEAKREELEKDIYDKGDDSNVSDFDNHDIDSSENELNSIEDFERAEDEEAKRESNESLNSLNAHQQLLKTFMDKGYSIYKIDKENLIDSVSKSTLYYQKNKYKENCSFERRPGSGRKPKFEESIRQKIIDLVTDDPYKSIKDIKHELQNDFSKAPSIGGIYSILKDNGFCYVAPQLAPKTDDKIRNKRLNWCKRNKSRDWSNIIFMDECTFYLKPPRGKKWIKKGEDYFEDSSSNKQKINCWGAFSSNDKCILHFFKENMTNSLYEEILEDYLPEFKRICKGDVKILMDNHPVHKSMNSLLFYKEHKIKVIDFPPYSPDLNPIENIWGKIKKEIMKKEYQTLSVMTKDICKEWDNITESQLRNYSASMNDRMKSCLQLKGSITKY